MYHNNRIIENNISNHLINTIYNFSKMDKETYIDRYLNKIKEENEKSNNNLIKIFRILFNNHDYDSMINMISLMNFKKNEEKKLIAVINFYKDWDLFEYDNIIKHADGTFYCDTEKINKKAVEEHTFFRKMSEKWIEGFRRFSKDDWCSVLQNKDTDLTKYIHKLEDEELLPVDLWYNTDIENAIKESFLGYINNENQIDESLFELWKKHVGETMKATLVNYVVDSIQNPSQINIIQLVKLIHLYVGNSKRLNENKYANSFYDEYFNRFIKETPISSLLQFTIDNWAKLHKYALLLSNDRIDRLITVMDQRKKEIPVEAQGLPKWEEYIKILQSLSIKENTIVA